MIKTDFEKGYEEAKAGYYDKWYRYNRKDQGYEYDRGVNKAKEEGYIIETMIECNN